MATKVSNGLDLDGYAILNALLHPVGSDPVSPADGQMWYRTDTGRFMVRQGGATKTLAILDDVTAGAISAALWNAQSVVVAVTDNTPTAITIGEDTLLGRSTGGDISAQSAAQIRTMINVANGATANATDAALRARSSHTGTQTASTISDFDAEVASNSAVAANTAKVTNATHSGDVTGSGALTIANNAVTNGKLADMATARIKGRVTAATGDPEDLTAAQVLTLLGIETGATADQTAAEILAKIITVDGPGSNLDADTLDGIQASGFATTGAIAGLASETYVDAAISALVDTSPGTLDTLNELAAALGDDPNFATTVTSALATKTEKVAANLGNGAATTIDVAHSLGTLDVVVSVVEASTGDAIICDWKATSTSNVRFTFGTAPSAAEFRATIVG